MKGRSAILLLLMATLAATHERKLLREYCARHIRNADEHVLTEDGKICKVTYHDVPMTDNKVLDECEYLTPFQVASAKVIDNGNGFECEYKQDVECLGSASAVIGSVCYHKLTGDYTFGDAHLECQYQYKGLLAATSDSIRFLTSILPHEIFWTANVPYGNMRKADLVIGGEKMFDEKNESNNAYALHTGFHVTLATRPGTMIRQLASRRLSALCQTDGVLSKDAFGDLLEKAKQIYGGILRNNTLYTLSKSLYTPIVGAGGKPNYDAMDKACQFLDESLPSGVLMPTTAEAGEIIGELMKEQKIPEIVVAGYRGKDYESVPAICKKGKSISVQERNAYNGSYHLLLGVSQYEIPSREFTIENKCNDYGSNQGAVFRLEDVNGKRDNVLHDAPTFIRTPVVCWAGERLETKTYKPETACSGPGSKYDASAASCKCEDGYSDQHDKDPRVPQGVICHACHSETHPLHVIIVLDYSGSMRKYQTECATYVESWGSLAAQKGVKMTVLVGNSIGPNFGLPLRDYATAQEFVNAIHGFGKTRAGGGDYGPQLLEVAANTMRNHPDRGAKKLIIYTGDYSGIGHPTNADNFNAALAQVRASGSLFRIVMLDPVFDSNGNFGAYYNGFFSGNGIRPRDVQSLDLNKVDKQIEELKATLVKTVCDQL